MQGIIVMVDFLVPSIEMAVDRFSHKIVNAFIFASCLLHQVSVQVWSDSDIEGPREWSIWARTQLCAGLKIIVYGFQESFVKALHVVSLKCNEILDM